MTTGEIEVISVRKRRTIKYDITENECWECTSHNRNTKGYPKIMINHKLLSISRYIYELKFGEIPKGLVIRHKCDNRACINLKHLETGTSKDNYDDMVKRNRRVILIGEAHGRSRLTQKQVCLIREDGRYQYIIAKEYGVSKSLISLIKNNKTWRVI